MMPSLRLNSIFSLLLFFPCSCFNAQVEGQLLPKPGAFNFSNSTSIIQHSLTSSTSQTTETPVRITTTEIKWTISTPTADETTYAAVTTSTTTRLNSETSPTTTHSTVLAIVPPQSTDISEPSQTEPTGHTYSLTTFVQITSSTSESQVIGVHTPTSTEPQKWAPTMTQPLLLSTDTALDSGSSFTGNSKSRGTTTPGSGPSSIKSVTNLQTEDVISSTMSNNKLSFIQSVTTGSSLPKNGPTPITSQHQQTYPTKNQH